MQLNQPTTVTNLSGQEVTVNTTPQGVLIKDGSSTVMAYGELADGKSIGLQFNDATNERIFIGKDASGNLVVKMSKAGFDARTTSNSNLIMSSAFDMFKIIASGTVVVDASAGTASQPYTKTVAHGQSAPPAFVCFINTPSQGAGWMTTPYVDTAFHTGLSYLGIASYTWTDTTNLNLRIAVYDSAASYGVFTFKYYIFQETAN